MTIRTQIYLTKDELNALRKIATSKNLTQSELIHEAIDKYIVAHRRSNHVQLLQKARSIWANREDIDAHKLRTEWDRQFEQQA